MGMTKKPCPGCGETPAWRREADKVCDDCQKLIQDGLNVRAAAAAEQVVVTLPSASYNLPHFRECGEFQKCFYQLVQSLGPMVNGSGEEMLILERMSCGFYPDSVRMNRESLACLRELYAAVRAAVEKAFEDGRQQGEDLLGNIAAGRVTLEELNRRTLGKTKGEPHA